MAGQERRKDRTRRRVQAALRHIGQEVRQARLDLNLSQAATSAAIGKSTSSWSRLERGEALHLPLLDLMEAASVVGLEVGVRAFPGGYALRDVAHLELLERLRAWLGDGCAWRTEVPLPDPGDRRAWDALIRVAHTRVGVEAETRAQDAQALQRRLALKRRDGGVDHVILLLSNTRHNRAFVRNVGAGFLSDFPVPAHVALERLAAGEEPGGSAIILL